VKKIWSYVKEKEIQDPSDKRYILCDNSLQEIFGVPRISMFKMNKVLSTHIKTKEDVVE